MGAVVSLSWRSLTQSFRRDAQVRIPVIVSFTVALVGVIALALAAASFTAPTDNDRFWRGISAIGAGITAYIAGLLGHAADPLDERSLVMAGLRPTAAAVRALGACLLSGRGMLWIIGGVVAGLIPAQPTAIPAAIAAGVLLAMADRAGVLSARYFVERKIHREVRSAGGYLALLLAVGAGFMLLFWPVTELVQSVDTAVSRAFSWVPLAGAVNAPLLVGEQTEFLVASLVAWGGAIVFGLLLFAIGWRSARNMMLARTDGGPTRLGYLRVAIGSPSRAIAWRIATAWLRDPRYGVMLVSIAVLPLIIVIPLLIAGADHGLLALLLLPLWAFLLGWALHNDLAYDSTAMWIHITSGMRGSADRLGRAIPTVGFGTLLIAFGTLLLAPLSGGWLNALASAVGAVTLLWVSAGGSSIMSAVAPYPVARPDDPPLSQPVRSWGSAVVAHPLAGGVEVALSGPAMWFAWQAVVEQSWSDLGMAAAVGAVTGAIVFFIGVMIGGRIFERRATRLLEFAQSV